MKIIRRLEDLDTTGCVLVPTMGALHAGHATLIARGVREAGLLDATTGCVVSIFINPTQFGDASDLDAYPRTRWHDITLCADLGVSGVFIPTVEAMYPPGQTVETPPLPAQATGPRLEDAGREGHFAGVCQVVSRLFSLIEPAAAVFGEKDWQQLQVIRAMAQAQRSGIEILGEPIVREGDGLAFSSRNARLSPDARAQAPVLSRALACARPARSPAEGERLMHAELIAADAEPAYATIRDARTLLAPTEATTEWRALVAATVGGVRLLDNAPWWPPEVPSEPRA